MKIIIILCLIPALIWLTILPPAQRFLNPDAALRSIGQVLGLTGMALFAISIILSSRFKLIEKYFDGQNVVYQKHHFLGGLSLVLLLFHPLTLSLSRLNISPQLAAKLLLPGQSGIEVAYGSIALNIMILLLVLTFFLRPAYHLWKLSHKFLALAFLLAFLHLMFIQSDVSRSLLLKDYLLLLSILAFISIVCRVLFPQLFISKVRYKIFGIVKISQNISELILEPVGRKLSFHPGQFVFLSILDKNLGLEEHPFSLASSPLEKNIRILVKDLGDYTKKINSVKSGTPVLLEGPFGKFSNNFHNNSKEVWIAGGIGVTPFLGMAKQLLLSKDKDVVLYYCVRNKEDAVFEKELRELEKKMPNFKLQTICSVEKGRLEAQAIEKDLGDLVIYNFLLCGPKSFMSDLKNQLIEKGVQKDYIQTEEFEL